jgi:PAS domain-containing protein
MILEQTALILIGLLVAAWTLAAGWAVLWARGRVRKAEQGQRASRRLSRMIDESPALPLLVRTDGRIEGPSRLAGWFGLDAMPGYLSELDAGDRGLPAEQLGQLLEHVRRAQKSAAPFRMVATPRGSAKNLALRGHLSDPQVSPGGAALVWVFDFSDSEAEMRRLRAETQTAQKDFAGLSGLIEAAPLPMWFRGPDGSLRIVNSAYVAAVGAASAEEVVAGQVELVEPTDGGACRSSGSSPPPSPGSAAPCGSATCRWAMTGSRATPSISRISRSRPASSAASAMPSAKCWTTSPPGSSSSMRSAR